MDNEYISMLLDMLQTLNSKLDLTNTYLKSITSRLADMNENILNSEISSQLNELSESLESLSQGYSLKDIAELM